MLAADFGDCHAAEDAWRATPGVIPFPEVWEWSLPLPVTHPALRAFTSVGAKVGDTMGEFALKLRAHWPAFRH